MNLLFLDVETGGLDPTQNPLLQVGAVAVVDGEVKGRFEVNTSFDPQKYTCHPTALVKNQILLAEHQRLGKSPSIAVMELISFLTTHFDEKPILVGHNPAIDKYMVRLQLFQVYGLDMDKYISHRMIDTMSLIWGLHMAGILPKSACSSDGAFEHFGIVVDKRHTGLGDSEATRILLGKLVDLIGRTDPGLKMSGW